MHNLRMGPVVPMMFMAISYKTLMYIFLIKSTIFTYKVCVRIPVIIIYIY